MAQVLYQACRVAAAVAFGVAQLLTDLDAGLAEPDIVDRCELPGNPRVRRRVRNRIRRARGHMTGPARRLAGTGPARVSTDIHAVRAALVLTDDRPHRDVVRTDVTVRATRMHHDGFDTLPGHKTLIPADAAQSPRHARSLIDSGVRNGDWRRNRGRDEQPKQNDPHGVNSLK